MNKDYTSLFKNLALRFSRLAALVSITFVANHASAAVLGPDQYEVLYLGESRIFQVTKLENKAFNDVDANATLTATPWYLLDDLTEILANEVAMQAGTAVWPGTSILFATEDSANVPVGFNSSIDTPVWHYYPVAGSATKSYQPSNVPNHWAVGFEVVSEVPEINGSQLGIALTLLLSLVLLYREREGFQA